MSKIVYIFTDGACSNNQSSENIGGWGAVLSYNGTTKELFGGEVNTTNNKMELMAVIEALKNLKSKALSLKIYSDSSYFVNCFKEKWYVKWQLNGWMTSQKKPVENQGLWMELIELLESFESFECHRLKGHLDPKKSTEMKKWKTKMEAINGESYTDQQFLELTEMNILADALANKGVDSVR